MKFFNIWFYLFFRCGFLYEFDKIINFLGYVFPPCLSQDKVMTFLYCNISILFIHRSNDLYGQPLALDQLRRRFAFANHFYLRNILLMIESCQELLRVGHWEILRPGSGLKWLFESFAWSSRSILLGGISLHFAKPLTKGWGSISFNEPLIY